MTETSKRRYTARYASKASGITGAPCWYVWDRFMEDLCASGLTKQQAEGEASQLWHLARAEYGLESPNAVPCEVAGCRNVFPSKGTNCRADAHCPEHCVTADHAIYCGPRS